MKASMKAASLVPALLVLLVTAPTVSADTSNAHVSIQGTVSGVAADFGLITVILSAQATGGLSSLNGQLAFHPSNTGALVASITGSTDGTSVTFSGKVVGGAVPFATGTPVNVVADTSGAITFTLGPIAGGPHAGDTFVFTGSGLVIIT